MDLSTVILPCPECKLQGYDGAARIGNRRGKCSTCNRFSQNVARRTRKALLDKYKDEYKLIKARVELDLYPTVIDEFKVEHGMALGDDASVSRETWDEVDHA